MAASNRGGNLAAPGGACLPSVPGIGDHVFFDLQRLLSAVVQRTQSGLYYNNICGFSALYTQLPPSVPHRGSGVEKRCDWTCN